MPDPNSYRFAPVVVAPTHNNGRTLADVLTRVAAFGLPIIVVNDGCTDASRQVLEQWQLEHPAAALQVLTHPRNRGKAAALLTGFAAAMKQGYTHALTIDTDGQHDPNLIPGLLDISRQSPSAYVLGVRDDTVPDYPARSRIGRRLSNFFIRLESGLRVRDSQCGMRVYPLELIRTVRCRSGHFGFETEIITRAAWAHCPVREVPVNTCYLPPDQRVSHFRPWLDSIRWVGMHLRLLGRTINPWPHPRYGLAVPARAPRSQRFRWRHWAQWLNPLRAFRELRRGHIGRTELATGLSLGVFVGTLPVYGFQTVLGLYLGRRLHLHPLAVIAGTQISTPPVGPALIAGSICLGHLVLRGALPPLAAFHLTRESLRLLAGPLLTDWIVGSVLLGAILATITFVLTKVLFRKTPPPLRTSPRADGTKQPSEVSSTRQPAA